MLIEKFKSELRKSDSKFKRLFSPSTVNRYLQVLSRILSMVTRTVSWTLTRCRGSNA